MSFSGTLTQTFDVYRRGAVEVNAGGEEIRRISDVPISSGNAGLIQPVSGKEIIKDRDVVIATLLLFCDYGIDIEATDTIESNGTRYEVVNVENAGGANHHLEVALKEVRV